MNQHFDIRFWLGLAWTALAATGLYFFPPTGTAGADAVLGALAAALGWAVIDRLPIGAQASPTERESHPGILHGGHEAVHLAHIPSSRDAADEISPARCLRPKAG